MTTDLTNRAVLSQSMMAKGDRLAALQCSERVNERLPSDRYLFPISDTSTHGSWVGLGTAKKQI